MLNGAFSRPKMFMSAMFIIPLEGLSKSAQLTANSRWGIIIGMMEIILNRNFMGMSVRLLRYARNKAIPVAVVEEPRTKTIVLTMTS